MLPGCLLPAQAHAERTMSSGGVSSSSSGSGSPNNAGGAEIETPLIGVGGTAHRRPAVGGEADVEAAQPSYGSPDEAVGPGGEGQRAAEGPTRGARRGRRLLRLLNVSDPAILFYAALVVNAPQMVVVCVVFGLEWDADSSVCDAAARERWRVWGAAHAARLGATTVIAGLRWRFAEGGEEAQRGARRRAAALVANARNSLDALALIWFVVGNMWLLGGSDADCDDATKSPIYVVDVAMLVIQYAQICLPCVFAIAMVPVFCFCLPCVIRLLASLHEPTSARGASRRAISELPLVTYAPGLELGGEEPSCSVCISDFERGDQLRLLPCKHAFHSRCVDQWLTVNANCPLCRKSIFADDDDDRRPDSAPAPAAAAGTARPPRRQGSIELETSTPLTATPV